MGRFCRIILVIYWTPIILSCDIYASTQQDHSSSYLHQPFLTFLSSFHSPPLPPRPFVSHGSRTLPLVTTFAFLISFP